ncbi:MAG: T9SS type B sorting domain-containing protein [Flavobacteriaceae bacterium]
MKNTALLWMMCLCFAVTYAQGETSNWYFGRRAGIQFNTDGSVTALDDGRLTTFEGCATISDSFGDLLFYTDGITIYDRTHTIMQNGQALYGDASSTQSAIIVPDPADPDLFYVFTVDTKIFEDDPDFGLNYSVVDISQNNGLGAVTVKNVNLLADCSEKITAVVKDCADQSYWLLTLSTSGGSPGLLDTFHAFEINAAGVVATSVKTTFNDLAIQDPRGYLKLSPDGTRVACANDTSGMYLYDFDTDTGQLSNQMPISIGGMNRAAYGVEFSPNGQLLYVHASNDQQGEDGHSSTLYQYDLVSADINASEVVLDDGSDYRAGLQLGANGKIYRTISQSYTTGTSYLGVVHNPDERGIAANYEHQAVYLGSSKVNQGLPPFIQSFFNTTAIIRNADGTTSKSLELCDGESFLLQTDDIPGATYVWERDGVSIANPNNSLQVDPVALADSGRYSVTITTPDPTECPIVGEAFIKVNPVPEAPELWLIQCDVDPGASEDGFSAFNLEESILEPELQYQFFETIADRDSDNPIVNPGNYINTVPFNQTIYYRITNEFECRNNGELLLEVRPNPFAVQSDHTLYSCDEDPADGQLNGVFELLLFAQEEYPDIEVSFYNNPEDVALKTNQLPDSYNSTSGTIYARLELMNECLGVDKIDLEVLVSPDFSLEEQFLLCTDNPQLVIEGPAGFDFYRWEHLDAGVSEPFSELQTVPITEIGNYRLTAGYIYDFSSVSIQCAQSSDFQVLPSNRATFEEILIEDFRDSNNVQVVVSGDGDYEYSLDGFSYQSSDTFGDIAPGFYTLFVRDRNGCGTSSKDISVLGYPKFFTPNGDGINDLWQIIGTNEIFQSDAFITIYDRYGKLLAQINPLTEGWNGSFKSNPLPSSDYWFRVKLSDGREITGHFALKR